MSTTSLKLLDVVELLGELTSDTESLTEIPRVLVSLLPLDRVTFALVRQTAGEPQRMVVAAGVEMGDDATLTTVPIPAIADERDGTAGAPGPKASAGISGLGTTEAFENKPSPAQSNPPIKIIRQLNASHRMILTLHWGRRRAALSPEFAGLLDTIGDALARALGTLLSWREQPALLGGCFSKITGTQWHVLCHLHTDLSEKELTGFLKITPHTLHSHIKDIYRTLGVRSRLGAVHVLQQATRNYRAKARQWSAAGPTAGRSHQLNALAYVDSNLQSAACEDAFADDYKCPEYRLQTDIHASCPTPHDHASS